MAAVWVRAAGILAVLLGLKAAFWPSQLQRANCGRPRPSPWPAAAGAAMAVWRRREGWAFSAAPGRQSGRLAGRLALPVRRASFEEWWLRLVQANVIASAAVALALAGGPAERLYRAARFHRRRKSLAGPPGRNAGGRQHGVAGPAGRLAGSASRTGCRIGRPAWLRLPAWLGLLLAAAAAGWYVRHTPFRPRAARVGAACCWAWECSPPAMPAKWKRPGGRIPGWHTTS